VEDDFPPTKRFAAMGRPRHDCKTCGAIQRLAILAVLAESIATCANTPSMDWYVAARRTRIVVVIDAVCGRLVGLVDGVKGNYFRHWASLL
jgi:hypothetical protein